MIDLCNQPLSDYYVDNHRQTTVGDFDPLHRNTCIKKKQLDWLATNTDIIITQSHSLFACSHEKKSLTKWKTGLS
jgi:hypothetical protein